MGENNTITVDTIREEIVKTEYKKMGKKTTICLITLKNGFEVVGESACVDPENFNETTGQHYAFENAYEKIWQLEGYALQKKLAEGRDSNADTNSKLSSQLSRQRRRNKGHDIF